MSKHNGNPPLTDWFPPEVKPVHVGWYERDYEVSALNKDYDYWDGIAWYYGTGFGEKSKMAVGTSRRWRGLFAPAKESE